MSEQSKRPRCAAKSKQSGERCKNTAVPGKRVCRFHGGLSPGSKRGNTKAVKHGFYSDVLMGEEREQFHDLIRAKPQGPAEEIALLRVKIKRYLKLNGDSGFNFDDWEKDTRREFDTEVKGKKFHLTETVKKPCGPGLLLQMLGELRKQLLALVQIEQAGGGGSDTPESQAELVRRAMRAMDARHEEATDDDDADMDDSDGDSGGGGAADE